MMRFSPFSRSTAPRMLSVIAARIGTDRSGMTRVYQNPCMSPTRCIPCRWMGSYACREISRKVNKPAYVGNCYGITQSPEIRSNKISFCVRCRGAGNHRPFDRIHLVATNGQSVTHPPSAPPRVQRSHWSHNRPAKELPSSHSQSAHKSVPRMVGRQNILTHKRERVGGPCPAPKLRDRKSNNKKWITCASGRLNSMRHGEQFCTTIIQSSHIDAGRSISPEQHKSELTIILFDTSHQVSSREDLCQTGIQ